jgi:hypothetical protein
MWKVIPSLDQLKSCGYTVWLFDCMTYLNKKEIAFASMLESMPMVSAMFHA